MTVKDDAALAAGTPTQTAHPGASGASPGVASAPDADRWHRAALTLTLEPASIACLELVGRGSVEEAWGAILDGARGAAMQAKAQIVARGVDAKLSSSQYRFVIPGDDEWPASADALAYAVPLHGVGGRPLGLWVRGPLRLCDAVEHAVAIVGSRAASHYGASVAADLGAGLAQQHLCVVSGGAYGIDAAAHRGALAGGGPSVCVLASGVDQAYPAGNTGLIERLAEEGLVISEYAPGSHPTRVRFLARNRLIAALSQGTVLVEAGARSGARNTVSWAHALGRTVMAVPGPVTSALSVTPHRLLRDAEASLVTCDAEIVELLAPMGAATLFDATGPDRVLDALDDVERQLYEALPGQGARTSEALVLETGLVWPRAAAGLSRLEARGLIERTISGYRLTRRRADDVTAPGQSLRVERRAQL